MLCIHFFPIEAPRAVEVTPKTTTSVTVTMNKTEGYSDVSYYEASYGREYCTVLRGVTPIRCDLENLKPGTRYRVGAVACMATAECSYKTFASGYTLPEGKCLTSK